MSTSHKTKIISADRSIRNDAIKNVASVLIAAFFFAATTYATNEAAVASSESKERGTTAMGGRLGDKEISCSKLQEKFPSVHPETVQRFYTAFAQESATRLMAYLEWRKAHVQLSTGDDTSDWRQAVTESSLYYTMGGSLRGLSHNPRTDSSLSFSQQVIFAPNVTDKEGYTVLHVLPARMDIGIDRSKEVYSCAFATYLETKLEDKPSDKVTFVVDTRAGRGWANPPMIRYAVLEGSDKLYFTSGSCVHSRQFVHFSNTAWQARSKRRPTFSVNCIQKGCIVSSFTPSPSLP